MRQVAQHWPMTWAVEPRPGVSLIGIFDFAELRATVDVLRVAAGLPPVAWIGRSDDDPTFVAGKTPIRAVHFTQLRDAVEELHVCADLPGLSQFSGGPIVPGTRMIKLSDILDLRGWVERYEALRPDLAARVVRLYGAYTVPGLDPSEQDRSDGRPTEMWDAAGHSRYFYDQGRLVGELRVLDSHRYWSAYDYDEKGRISAIVYPDGERVSFRYDPLTKLIAAVSDRGTYRLAAEPLQQRGEPDEDARALSDEDVRRDFRGRAILLGDPARPRVRLAYDGDGRLAKRVDAGGTTHLVGEHYERTISPERPDVVAKYLPEREGGRLLLVAERQGQEVLPAPSTERSQLWRTPDRLWTRVRPLLPEARDGDGASGDRDVLDGILHVLRQGGDWSKLPGELGSPDLVLGRFFRWRAEGVFDRLWRLGFAEHPALSALDWARLLTGGLL